MFSSLNTYYRIFQILGIVLIVGLIYFGYNKVLEIAQLRRNLYETRNYYAAAQDTLKRVRDDKNRETVIYRTAPLSPSALAGLEAGFAAVVRDQLRKEFKSQSAQLLFAQRAATVTQQVLPTVALKDTTVRSVSSAGIVTTKAARAGTFKDEWLSLTGIVTDDSLSVKYFIRNEFDVRAYSKKDKKYWFQFWKPRKVYVDLKNKNPNTITSSMEAVVVEKK
ncbi:DUF6549 family protein [Hymenobacter sp. YC55]|uniref:DUF6549 family protein n=1 Tax=Hymenobacter sp. YC55 TaxID=3034019 RepID=UPI0023F6C1F3|nr:DUF6549 family protein [Hymenobacter sp. YC55]MDF7810686.1 hypothetical protein [Hymenobacter sp. YC55]